MREIAGIQKPVVEYAKRLGWKVRWKMRIEGRRGAPDYWLLRNGIWLLIEFKSPTGELSESQIRRIKELRENGQPVHVIDNREAGYALLDRFEDSLGDEFEVGL